MHDLSPPPAEPTPAAPAAMAQWRGWLSLAGDGFGTVSSRIEQFHRAIARQPFAALDAVPGLSAASAPVRVLHDGITAGVYLAVREIGSLAFGTLDAGMDALDRAGLRTPPPSSDARRMLAAVGSAVSGAFGDHLQVRRNALAPRAAFYRDGEAIALQADALRQRYPQAQRRLVVFVHGLCCNEDSWRLYHDPARPASTPYGEQLERAGYSALYLRYNTGLHISGNGRRLAQLLDRLVARWPVAVDDIVLIGHSMGGLVSRSAVAHAMRADSAWLTALRHVICLGSPHRGAALEKAAHGVAQALQAFELSRAWGEALDMRSVGIRDLRYGATASADWRDALRREWRPPQPLARAAHAHYHFIGSSIGRDAGDWRGALLGDGLVRLPSALAADLADADTATLFGRHHMQLLNDPQVYALIAAQLGVRMR